MAAKDKFNPLSTSPQMQEQLIQKNPCKKCAANKLPICRCNTAGGSAASKENDKPEKDASPHDHDAKDAEEKPTHASPSPFSTTLAPGR